MYWPNPHRPIPVPILDQILNLKLTPRYQTVKPEVRAMRSAILDILVAEGPLTSAYINACVKADKKLYWHLAALRREHCIISRRINKIWLWFFVSRGIY